MTERFRILISGIILTLICAGCAHRGYYKNAISAYNSGNYDAAVYMSLNALKSKPDYPEALVLLRNAAPLAYEHHIRQAESQKKLKNYDAAVNEYSAIEKLASAVASVRRDMIFEGVADIKALASRNAAEAHYAAGLTLLHEGEAARDNKIMRSAAIRFRKSYEFVPGYEDSMSLYDRARYGAMVRMAILNFSSNSWTDYGKIITDQILAKAVRQNPEFLEFVAGEHLYDVEKRRLFGRSGILDSNTAVKMGKAEGVQYIVVGMVNSANVDRPGRRDTRGSATCRIRESKDRERNGSAYWTIYELKAIATINFTYQLIDVRTGQIGSSDIVNASGNDATRWMTYGGDEGCLPSSASFLLNARQTVEGDRVLLERAIDKASTEIANKLVEKFK